MRKFLLYSCAGLIATSPAYALTCLKDYGGCAKSSVAAGDCADLGYSTEDVDGCAQYIYCPFNTEYKRCVYTDCKTLGYSTYAKDNWCAKTVKCPYDENYTMCKHQKSCQAAGYTSTDKSSWCKTEVPCPFTTSETTYTLCKVKKSDADSDADSSEERTCDDECEDAGYKYAAKDESLKASAYWERCCNVTGHERYKCYYVSESGKPIWNCADLSCVLKNISDNEGKEKLKEIVKLSKQFLGSVKSCVDVPRGDTIEVGDFLGKAIGSFEITASSTTYDIGCLTPQSSAKASSYTRLEDVAFGSVGDQTSTVFLQDNCSLLKDQSICHRDSSTTLKYILPEVVLAKRMVAYAKSGALENIPICGRSSDDDPDTHPIGTYWKQYTTEDFETGMTDMRNAIRQELKRFRDEYLPCFGDEEADNADRSILVPALAGVLDVDPDAINTAANAIINESNISVNARNKTFTGYGLVVESNVTINNCDDTSSTLKYPKQ